MKTVDLVACILLAICIVGIAFSSLLRFDASILVPIITALIGILLGTNTNNIVVGAKKVLGSFKKK